MCYYGPNTPCSAFFHYFGSFAKRAGCIGNIITDDYIFSVHVTEDTHLRYFIEVRAVFIADDHRHFVVGHGVQFFREIGSSFRTADIRRSDNQILEIEVGDVRSEDVRAVDMIDGDIEESLDLLCVQVNSDDAVRSCGLQHVSHEFGTDRDTWFILAVLTRPSEIGYNGDHFVRACPLGGIDHEEQLHEVVAGRTGGLYQINGLSSNGLFEIRTELSIREPINVYLP